MKKTSKTVLIGSAFALWIAQGLSAQEQAETAAPSDTAAQEQVVENPEMAEKPAEETAEEAPKDAENSVESQLSLGEDSVAELAVGQPYAKEKNGDWELRCIKAEEGQEDPCQMYQLLKDQNGAPVAEFSLFRLPQKGKAKAGATVVVPLETALPQQLTISVDGANARRYPYAFCGTVGCYARIGLTADDVLRYKRGNKATITLIPAFAQDQKVELDLSLTGFTATYDKVSVVNQ